MIPAWRKAFSTALNNLRPGGSIHIVDFYDQAGLPAWFRAVLQWWLRRFHVQFWADLLPHLLELERLGLGRLEIIPVARRYAFTAKFQTDPKESKILTEY